MGSEVVDHNKILVVNETDISLSGWQCPLLLKTKTENGTSYGYEFRNLPARSTVELTEACGRTLIIDRLGIIFKDVQNEDDSDTDHYEREKPRVLLEKGRTFHLINDPAGAPITVEEVHNAQASIATCLEHGGRLPPDLRNTVHCKSLSLTHTQSLSCCGCCC